MFNINLKHDNYCPKNIHLTHMVVTYSAPPSIILNSKDQELIEEDSMIGISLLQALKDEANLQVHTNCCHLRRINNNPIGSEVFMLDG